MTEQSSRALELMQDARDEARRIAANGWPVAGAKILEALAAAEQHVIGATPSSIGRIDTCEHGKWVTDYCQPCGRVNSV